MERRIKKEIMDTSRDYTRSPNIKKELNISNIKQELNRSNIKLEMSRSLNVSHDISESESAADDDESSSHSDGLPSVEDNNSTDDGSEVSSIGRPGTGHDSPTREPQRRRMSLSKVLDNAVGSPEDFDTVEYPGPLTMRDIKDDKEYYIVRFPAGLLNPADLIKTKFHIGGKDSHRIEVNKKHYEVSNYGSSTIANTPTLFLPDGSGQLGQVDLKISGHIVIKRPPLNPVGTQFNIDDLRSRIHKPPEIKERNFFGSSGTTRSEGETVTPKKIKLSKEEKRLSKEKKRMSKGGKNFVEGMGKRKSLDPKEMSSSPLFTPNKKIKKEREEEL